MNLVDYIKLYFHMVKYNIMAQMEFKANFIMAMLTEVGFLMSKVLYVVVMYTVGVKINGMTPEAMLMFVGSYTLITGVMDSVYYPNIASIPEYIRNGELDIYLTKPISTQYIVSFRKFDIGLGIPNAVAGIAMIVISWNSCDIAVTPLNILGYILFTIAGCIMTYPILFIPTMFAFWLVKIDALYDITFALWDFNNMPMTIYNKIMKTVGVYIIPIFLITNFAPMFVQGFIPKSYIIFTLFAIPFFFFLTKLLWDYSVKHYSSASS